MLSTDVLERQFLDALPFSLIALDLEGRVTSVNRPRAGEGAVPAFDKLDDARNTPVWDLLEGSAPRDWVERAMEALRTGRAPVVRWEFRRPSSDAERTFLAQLTPLHDESHAVSGYVLSIVDITPSHRREALVESTLALSVPIDLDRTLHELGQQVRRVVRCDAFAIAIPDPDSGAPRLVYSFGYDGNEPTLQHRLADAWRDALIGRRTTVSRDETGVEFTTPVLAPDGPVAAMSVQTEATDPADIDETERHLKVLAAHAGAAIERARLVRQAGHRQRRDAIGEVAAGVAHELRNPLFGISSAAQLLRFRAREDPVVEKNVGRILREVERLNRMVSALLELGRPTVLKLSPGDPDAVWDTVLESERGRLEARALAVRRTRPASPPSMPIDAEKLAQVFANILVNSIDAAPEATDVTLDSSVLPNGGWRCRLANQGEPIPPDALPRVFQIFFSTKPGSTGIGLALSERIVEEHRGTIRVASGAGSGTVVTIMLPPS